MKNLKYFLFAFALFFISCSDDDSSNNVEPPIEENSINDFIWNAMNLWYYWYADVPNLSDSKNDNVIEYRNFLNSYSTPEAFFEALKYQPDVVDRFSFMTSNYDDLQNTLQGISASFGHDYRLSRITSGSDELFGYVRYVLPNTPADAAGITRGDIFTHINGQQLTISNYYDLLFNQETYTVGFATIANGTIALNGETVTMTAVQIQENPVYLTETFDLVDGKKVGYLMYNQFSSQHNDELNEAFQAFKASGITDLVLDLRYNGGGSVNTATYLASMIYSTNSNLVFAESTLNDKLANNNYTYRFTDQLTTYDATGEETGTQTIQSLGLNSLTILVTGSTASASELMINGLNPYIDVTTIGTQTVGKNVGSVTLYDSPSSNYTDKSTANADHKYALQPIITAIINSVGFGEYAQGFTPTIAVNELDYLANLPALGTADDPLLGEALLRLCSTCRIETKAGNPNHTYQPISERRAGLPAYQVMTLD